MRRALLTLCLVTGFTDTLPAGPWSLGVSAPGDQRPSGIDPSISVPVVLEAATAYVHDYEEKLTSILADETYTQQIRIQVPMDASMARSRTLKSELFFMFAPATRDWMAIRDVIELDRKPLANRPDLRAALGLLPVGEVATAFKSHNSRFNLGRISRNFNEPTLSLLVLDRQYRGQFAFERKRVQGEGAGTAVTLAFKEHAIDTTLIRDLQLRPARSAGEFLIDAKTGRVARAILQVQLGSARISLTTEYAPNERLGMWVPVTFREHYEDGVAGRDGKTRLLDAPMQYEEITCEAKYSNFRRFEAAVRIK